MPFSAVAAALLLSTSVPSATQTEWAFVSMVNAERAAHGLRPLSVDERLVGPARSWSSVLATLPPEPGEACGLAHNPNLRVQIPQEAWFRLGENVACGDTHPEVVHRALMASPSHRANILNPAFDRIGVGVIYVGNTFFVTEDFLQPAEPSPAPSAQARSYATPQSGAIARPSRTVLAAQGRSVQNSPQNTPMKANTGTANTGTANTGTAKAKARKAKAARATVTAKAGKAKAKVVARLRSADAKR